VRARHDVDVNIVTGVAPRMRKIIKHGHSVFERVDHLLQNDILHFVVQVQSILRNGVGKLEFKQMKNRLFGKRLGT